MPLIISYFLSVGVIALTWSGHHEIFRHLRRFDGRLIVLNFGLLIGIAVASLALGPARAMAALEGHALELDAVHSRQLFPETDFARG
jgi:hypothetical protein